MCLFYAKFVRLPRGTRRVKYRRAVVDSDLDLGQPIGGCGTVLGVEPIRWDVVRCDG